MKVGSLFTGYGGLDRAAETFFNARTVWVSDIDPGACKILAHRYPDIPNLGDITAVDWATVEPIDILTGGWPCQPWSTAGKRLGENDERALWPEITRAVRVLRPRYVFLENVSSITSAGELARATADLSSVGYVGQWVCIRASDVGAPHRRERCFILATDPDSLGQQRGRGARNWRAGSKDNSVNTTPGTDGWGRNGRASGEVGGTVGRTVTARGGERTRSTTADTGRQHGQRWPHEVGAVAEHRRPSVEPERSSAATVWDQYGPVVDRWATIIGRPAPPPTETGPRGSQRLSSRAVEFMMGLLDGWVTDVPGLTRNPQLKALGNGVVPRQAYAALEILWARDAVAA